MKREFKPRFSSVVVGLLTIALGVLAWFNFDQQHKFRPPTDGVTWQERAGSVQAIDVAPGSPAERSGIRAGDVLVSINGAAVPSAPRVTRLLWSIGSWGTADYAMKRDGQAFTARIIPEPRDESSSILRYLQIVALLYLLTGAFVVLRRTDAPRALHFYLFCLTSFVLYFYRYTGKLNNFDWTIYWTDAVALLLQPALFVHFALVFPEAPEWVRRRRWLVPMVYAPAGLLLLARLAIASHVLEIHAPLLTVSKWLDSLDLVYLSAMFLAGAAVLRYTYRTAATPLLRQQMKWVTRGVVLGIVPFTAVYVLPYLFGVVPGTWMKASTLSLLFIPLAFAYAIVRYRLMDVDILFRRGVAYTLATVVLVGLYFTVVALVGFFFSANFASVGTIGTVIAMVASAFLVHPLRARIQERLDRYFYREGYNYRRTLVEFGRDLSAETDLDRMLASVVDRLAATLRVDKAAVLLVNGDRVELARSLGISFDGPLDLEFLNPARPELARGYLFYDNTRNAPGESEAAREAIAALDLHYYVACRAQGRIVAFLGLGKTNANDFLSSEDVELVETLSGYLGVAVENARLYQSLKRKVAEYERLKDFNENIVESINMGILVLDLDDRIESWNTQLELMFGLSRDQAYGRTVEGVFPPDLVVAMVRFRGDDGIHNLYKQRVRTAMGQDRVLNVAIAPLVTKNFDLIGRLVIFDDVSEQMEMEQQLVQAEKLSSIGLLAAGVAHEVNTPLSVISSYAQMLAKQMPPDDPRGKLLDKITRSTFRASEIVNNLLNFSRTGNGEKQGVDLNRVVHDTLGLLEHHFRSSRVQVDMHLAHEAPLVWGNAGRLQQVFLNLFLNARDAMPEGGVLRVSTDVGESAVQVEVADSGHGIPEEHLSRIYDPFFTTKSQAHGNGGNGGNGGNAALRTGTGLGLSVTYGIIQEHSGKIRVDSAPGRGANFLLEFPRLRKAVEV